MHLPNFCYFLYRHHTICGDPWCLPPSSPLYSTMLSLRAVHIAPARTTSPAPYFCELHLHTCPQLRHHECCKTHPCTCSLLCICASCELCLCAPLTWILHLWCIALPARRTSCNLSPSALS